MKLINYISDKHIDKSLQDIKTSESWNVRQAVRAILIDNKKRIALMHIAKYDVYKLPGGGIDEGEDLDTAFSREIMEETGCKAKILDTIGITIEKRDQWKLFQVSYCYIAKAIKVKKLQLTEEEIESGFSLHWVTSYKKALKLLSSNNSERYDDKYIKKRDYSILKAAKEDLNHKHNMALKD